MICKKLNIECDYVKICSQTSGMPINRHIRKIRNIDLELLQFYLFKKRRVVKKELIPLPNLKNTIQEYKDKKLNIFCYTQDGQYDLHERLYDKKYDDTHTFIMLIYKKREDLDHFMLNEFDNKNRCGNLLGYPNCCIEKYEKSETNRIKERRPHLDFIWRDKLFKGMSYTCPLINKDFQLFIHIPCSKTCLESIKMSQSILRYIEKNLGSEYVKAYFQHVKSLT